MEDTIVYIDKNSPYSGTDHPIGKSIAPVNNIEDARKIAKKLGKAEIWDVTHEVRIIDGNKTIFSTVKENIHSSTNCNFHWDALDWTTRVWILEICEVMESRLKELEDRVSEI